MSSLPSTSPWLSIPLADYERHMALPQVGQAAALASEFERLLREHRPAAVALLGCAGGNGLERVDPATTQRVVALDLNPGYVEATRRRYATAFTVFTPIVCDLAAAPAAPFAAVELMFAGLVLEYVPLDRALRFMRSGLRAGGVLGCILQQDSASQPLVSASPLESLAPLATCMRILAPQDVAGAAAACDLQLRSTRSLSMPNGKILLSQEYVAR